MLFFGLDEELDVEPDPAWTLGKVAEQEDAFNMAFRY